MDSRSNRRYESSNSRNEKEQPRVTIQHMRYKLTKLTQAQALFQIAMKTSGFHELSIHAADWVQRDVRSREFTSFGSLKAPEDVSLVQIITGDNDYYLNVTMKKHNVDYICYDNVLNQFQFWGEYHCCVQSMNELRFRIEKVSLRERAKQFPTSNGGTSSHDDDDGERNSKRPREDIDSTFELPKKEEQYSKFAVDHMSKMGFVPAHGLGRHKSGRAKPIDPVSDLGGRTSKNNFGIGFSGISNVVEEDQPQTTVGRSMSIAHDEEEPPTDMMSNLSIGTKEN